jgi:hypothetical protein
LPRLSKRLLGYVFGHLCIESLYRKLKVETHLSFKFIYIYGGGGGGGCWQVY